MSKRRDHTGKIYNHLKCLEFVGIEKKRTVWKVECLLCGRIKNVQIYKIIKGIRKSCGCNRKMETILYCEKQLFSQYRFDANSRDLAFEISFEHFIKYLKEPCYYCGEKETNTFTDPKHKERSFKYNGIDRMDNTKGYVQDNLLPCCGLCNWMKKGLTFDDFMLHLYKIIHNRITDWQKVN